MKLTSMFESASESAVVKCSQDGEKSDQSGALLVPVSADSCDLSSSKSKIKEDRPSPVLNLVNGDSDAQADLKKTLEPLSLSNGDGASSDDLERISCRTPVGDNDSSSEKENYLFDDGGSEASLKLRVTESEDEGEMSPRATSPFEDMDQECSNQVLSQTKDNDGTNGETKDSEMNCDDEQQDKCDDVQQKCDNVHEKCDDEQQENCADEEQETCDDEQQENCADEKQEKCDDDQRENEDAEPDRSSPIVKDQDNEISGKLLKSEEDDGPDSTCVQEEDCHNTHAESAGSDDCPSAELVEPEKSEQCCDIASDSDTVKCSCDGVCSSTCSCSVSKQEIVSNLTPCTESNISLELDECSAENPVTHSGEDSGSLSISDTHVSAKECSNNNETGISEDCSSNTILTVCEPTVSESEVTTDVEQNTFKDKESISEESVTDLKTTGDLTVTNTVEDEPSSVVKLVGPVIMEDANSVTGAQSIRANTESNSVSGDDDDDNEDGDLTSVKPVAETKTSEVLPTGSEVNGLSTPNEDSNYKENESPVSNSDGKLDSGMNDSEVCVENKGGGNNGRKDSETVLPFTESKWAASENSVTVTNSETFPGEGSETDDTKDIETDDMKDSEIVEESKLAASQNSFTVTNSATFPREGTDAKYSEADDMKDIETDDMKDSEIVEESKLAASQNSFTVTNSATFPGEGSDEKYSEADDMKDIDTEDMKDSEIVEESKLAASQNSFTVTNSATFSGEVSDTKYSEADDMKDIETNDMKDTEILEESKLAASQSSVNSATFPGEGSDDTKDSETVLPLAESKLAASQNSTTVTNSVTCAREGSDDMKDSETMGKSKLASSQNSATLANSANLPGEGSGDMKVSEALKESKFTVSQNSVTTTDTVDFPVNGSDDMKDSELVDESKSDASPNSVAITNSVTVPGEGSDDLKDNSTVSPLAGSKLSASQNSTSLKNSIDVCDDSAVSSTDDSQENTELMQPHLEAPSENVPENKQASLEMPSAMSPSNITEKKSDTRVDGKEILCNGTMDDRTGAVIKEKESSSSECDKMADSNDNVLMINQTNDRDRRECELEMKGSQSSVDVDLNVKDSKTNEIIGRLNVDASVEKERAVDSNMELVSVANKIPKVKNKSMETIKDTVTSNATKGEMKSPVKLPETGVGGSNKEKTTETELNRGITARTTDYNIVASVNSCEIEEPLTLSDVANALKDAVDTVTLQEGESVPYTSCEPSVPPLSSEVHNLPPSDMLISDNTAALAVHVADQEVQPENVQEAPGVTEALRRRRKRSIEDTVPDRISKRTRGSTSASNSATNSPEKITQTNSESAKRPVLDSSVEEDAKRMRLTEEYDKVVKGIEQTVAPNGIVTGDIGSRRVFLEKIRAKDLKNLTVAELEEFFVEKIIEALAYRHELGVMRQKQQAVENQMEIWRKKTLAMCKQVRDMELVMKRYQNDLKTRKDRPVIPVKVTRSVGLQVHDVSVDPSSRALLHKRKRLEQQASSVNTPQRPSPQTPSTSNVSTVPTSQSASVATRGTTSSPQYSRTPTSTNSQTNVPAAGTRVPPKPNSGLKTLMPRQQSVSINTNTANTSPTTANSSRPQQVTRSKVANSAGGSPVGSVNKTSRQVIDLTDDGDRGRSAQPRTSAVMTPVNTNTVPANNSVGASTTLTPTSSIRILPQPVTATAVTGANILATGVTTNSSVPRLTYLVPTTNQLQQRPVLLASSPSQGVANAVVTMTSGQKNQAPAVFVKNGAVVLGSGAVGPQVTTAARPAGLQPPVAQGSPSRPQIRPAQILPGSPQSRSLPQHGQHPAPLPAAPNLNLNNPDLKKMPPRPELKISKQSRHQGIVLSWNMPVTNEYAAIASYQLYAYQESSSPPSTAHWKKVGDVKALPLPMACTLTQFVEGHKYHFAVRAVDIHSRVGPFSLPGSIVLTRK